MISLGDVHYRYDLLDRNGLVCIDRECRVTFALEEIDKLVLDLVESDCLLISIDMVGEVVIFLPVFDRYAYGSLCRHLSGTFRKEKLQGIRVDQRRGDQKEYQQQEHDVSH